MFDIEHLFFRCSIAISKYIIYNESMFIFEQLQRQILSEAGEILCITDAKETRKKKMNLSRHEQIIEIMEKQSPISVRELAEKAGCTEMTIRRNLDQLKEKGLVQREHGYAFLQRSARKTDYFAEMLENSEEKKAIASVALTLIKPDMSLCLDSGTTIQQLVELIPEGLPLSVITPSLAAAMSLSSRKDIQVFMPGGFLHHSNRSLLIDQADALQRYQADIAFISCRSFQLPGGTFEHSQTLTNTKRTLTSIARQRVVLLDYSKWNISSIFNCIPLDQIDLIITDSKAPKEAVAEAEALGKTVIVA